MRLWHYKLIPYLPREQLLAQWRELNSIFVKQDNHILINYIYNYDRKYLLTYSNLVIAEMKRRGYQIRSFLNYYCYFCITHEWDYKDIFTEHDNEYFLICYYNLKEKYIRGQKGFTSEMWNKIEKLKEEMLM